MKQKTIATSGLVLAGLMMTGTAFAAVDENRGDRADKKQLLSSVEVQSALESNDYDAFILAVADTRAVNISEEVFNLKSDLYKADQSGDQSAAEEIKLELRELKKEARSEREENREARALAIESGDYTAFAALTPESKETPSEEVFELIIELRAAKDAGNEGEVIEIKSELQELGFEGKKHRGHKKGIQ